jgi:hypothetical protein
MSGCPDQGGRAYTVQRRRRAASELSARWLPRAERGGGEDGLFVARGTCAHKGARSDTHLTLRALSPPSIRNRERARSYRLASPSLYHPWVRPQSPTPHATRTTSGCGNKKKEKIEKSEKFCGRHSERRKATGNVTRAPGRRWQGSLVSWWFGPALSVPRKHQIQDECVAAGECQLLFSFTSRQHVSIIIQTMLDEWLRAQ